MLPEVEQYFETVDAVVKAYEEGVDAVTALPNTDAERTRRINALTAHRDTVVGSAWTLLGAVTNSKVVAWIVARFIEGMDGEMREALDEILKRLPMTQAELEEFAEDKGWCDSFEHYLQEALAAGVFAAPDWRSADSVKAAMARFEAYVDSQVSVAASSPQRTRLRELVLEVAEAARVLAVEDAADASEVVRPLTVSAPTAVTLPVRENVTESGLDISSWPEWAALQTAAEREFSPSPAYMEQFKTLVSAVARQAADHGARTVEASLPATALRNWVTSNVSGAERHMTQLRTLVTPIVLRAVR